MSRDFTRLSSEYLKYDAAVVSLLPFTMAGWFNCTNISVGQHPISLSRTTGAGGWYILGFGGGAGGDPIQAAHQNNAGSLAGVAETTTGYSSGTWHHAAAIFSTTSSRSAFIDGGSKGTDTTSVTEPSPLDVTSIGGRIAGGSGYNFFDGSIAEAAFWNVALTDAEVAILAAGYSPLFVRPQSLVAYWPLIRDEDQDRVGGYDMTAYNTPTIAAHPPVIYPAQVFAAAGAPPAGISIPVVMHHRRQLGMS